MSKQDQVVEMVKAGQYTREEIMAEVGCTPGALSSYLSGMRNAAKFTGAEICPTIDENGVFSVTTFEAFEEAKAEAAANRKPKAPTKTPEDRWIAASKRVSRCEKAAASARGRAENSPDDHELDLRAQKADIELELAQIEMMRAEADRSPKAADDDEELM